TGDDVDPAGGRGGDLEPHPVHRTVQAPAARRVDGRRPRLADDRDDAVAEAHLRVDDLGEIGPGLDRLHVDEDACRAEPGAEQGVEPPRRRRGVVSPIADEDARHGRSPTAIVLETRAPRGACSARCRAATGRTTAPSDSAGCWGPMRAMRSPRLIVATSGSRRT